LLSELANYLTRIEDLRSQVTTLIQDLPVGVLNWRPFDQDSESEFNSLAVLVAHISGAEQFWIGEVVGGLPAQRNRDLEFKTIAHDINDLTHLLSQTSMITNKIFINLSSEKLDETRLVENRPVPVRWAILHVIDHTALHLGQMQITRQLGTNGKNNIASPFWYQRLP